MKTPPRFYATSWEARNLDDGVMMRVDSADHRGMYRWSTFKRVGEKWLLESYGSSATAAAARKAATKSLKSWASK